MFKMNKFIDASFLVLKEKKHSILALNQIGSTHRENSG
jgi:hypothetical protein